MPLVALDARLTRQMSTGMQSYVRELAARLPAQAPHFEFAVFGNRALQVSAPNASFHTVSPALALNGAPGEQLFLSRRLARARPDLVHYMSVYAPRRSGFAHVYTVHDLIHLRFPLHFSWKVRAYYRWVVGPVARSSRFVITDAHATIADLHAYLRVDPARARVVPLGAADVFTLDDAAREERAAPARSRFELDKTYFIYAGNHRPHKNVKTLVEAWRMTQSPCDLVLTEEGPFGFSLDGGGKTNGRIVLTGRVTQEELIGLYAGCSGAVQPSLYEGFGLGTLEAMSAGAPAVVARTPALIELTEGAALTFLPHDAAGLAQHLDALASDPRRSEGLRAAGRRRARDFSWDRTARLTASVYEEALAT